MTDDAAERLPLLAPEALDEEQRATYDAMVSARAGSSPVRFMDEEGRLLGALNVMLYSPAVGAPLQAVGAAVRFGTNFTDREREIAILVLAAHHRSSFEWYAHERIGRAIGISEEELATLRTGDDLELTDARERVVHATTKSLVTAGDVSDEGYAEAVTALGHATVVELVTLVGYYAALALQARVFRVGVPAGEPAPDWR